MNCVSVVWPQLLIQSHHVPLLPTVPRFADLLDLPLQSPIHTAPLLLQQSVRKMQYNLKLDLEIKCSPKVVVVALLFLCF